MSWESFLYKYWEEEILSGGSGLLGITAEIEDHSSILLTLLPSGSCLNHCYSLQRNTPEDVNHKDLTKNLRDTDLRSGLYNTKSIQDRTRIRRRSTFIIMSHFWTGSRRTAKLQLTRGRMGIIFIVRLLLGYCSPHWRPICPKISTKSNIGHLPTRGCTMAIIN